MPRSFPPLLTKRGREANGPCPESGPRPVADCPCAACSWVREVEEWPRLENHGTQAAARRATKRVQQALWNLCVDEEVDDTGKRVPHVRMTGMRPSSRSWRWSWRDDATRSGGVRRVVSPPEPTGRVQDTPPNPWPDEQEEGLWWQIRRLRQIIEEMDELDREHPGRTRGLKALYRVDLDALPTPAGGLERARRQALSELQLRVRAFLHAEEPLTGRWIERERWRSTERSGTAPGPQRTSRRAAAPLDPWVD